MKTPWRWLWIVLVLTLPIAAILVLSAPVASGPPAASIDPEQSPGPTAPTASPVEFLGDPGSPSYAQTAITVFPDPPEAGRPAETCVWVINTGDVTQSVTVDFGVANFGMGVPFDPIGSRTVTSPPLAPSAWPWIGLVDETGGGRSPKTRRIASDSVMSLA